MTPDGAKRRPKDWTAILRDYSSGEDSDAHDSLNVVSVQKNAKRVAELLQDCVPGLEAYRRPDAPRPMGMNDPSLIRDGLAAAMRGASPHSPEAATTGAPAGTPSPASHSMSSLPSAEGQAEATSGST